MDETHWVYVIAHELNGEYAGPVKIGYSKNVMRRLANIQTSCPSKVGIAYVFELPNREAARYLEGSFHGTQKDRRAHGEWYDCEPVIAIHLLCIGYRAFLKMTESDPALIESILGLSGVLWAEKRFGLATPDGGRLQ